MRKVLFWFHLVAGVIAGLIVFIMAVTGTILAFERQTLDWADRHAARVTPPPGAARLSVADLIAKTGKTPSGVVVHSDPSEPVEIMMGKAPTIYMNPYTGEVTGHPSKGAHDFFIAMRNWHRWFALNAETKVVSVPIYDAVNILFFFILLSGPFLWWPKKMTWRHLRPIVWFRGGLASKARDFNWHNVLGLWASVPLMIIAVTGMVLSYEWANELLYTMTGTEMPERPEVVPAKKGEAPPAWQGVDTWIAHAGARKPDWRTITIRNSPARNIGVSVDSGTGGQPQKRGTLTVDRATLADVSWETFSNYNAGFKLRLISRVSHSGEIGGMPVQILAALVSLAAAVLVYTGFALSLRRFAAWRRRRARSEVPDEVTQVA